MIRSSAIVTYTQRRHYWLRAGEPIVCPNGHKLKHNAAVLQHEAFICQHRPDRGGPECGARVYVLAMPNGLKFVAEVTVAEMLTMRDRHMSVDEVIAYLRGQSA